MSSKTSISFLIWGSALWSSLSMAVPDPFSLHIEAYTKITEAPEFLESEIESIRLLRIQPSEEPFSAVYQVQAGGCTSEVEAVTKRLFWDSLIMKLKSVMGYIGYSYPPVIMKVLTTQANCVRKKSPDAQTRASEIASVIGADDVWGLVRDQKGEIESVEYVKQTNLGGTLFRVRSNECTITAIAEVWLSSDAAVETIEGCGLPTWKAAGTVAVKFARNDVEIWSKDRRKRILSLADDLEKEVTASRKEVLSQILEWGFSCPKYNEQHSPNEAQRLVPLSLVGSTLSVLEELYGYSWGNTVFRSTRIHTVDLDKLSKAMKRTTSAFFGRQSMDDQRFAVPLTHYFSEQQILTALREEPYLKRWVLKADYSTLKSYFASTEIAQSGTFPNEISPDVFSNTWTPEALNQYAFESFQDGIAAVRIVLWDPTVQDLSREILLKIPVTQTALAAKLSSPENWFNRFDFEHETSAFNIVRGWQELDCRQVPKRGR